MALSHQVFTDAGIDMLGQADAGATLVIDEIVVGAGVAAQDSDIYPLIALIDWKASVLIQQKVDQGGGKMLLTGSLNEWDLTGPPFSLRELGVMAHIQTAGPPPPPQPPGTGLNTGDSPTNIPAAKAPKPPDPNPNPHTWDVPTLYCASNVYTDPFDTITPGGLNTHAFSITIEIDRATNVVVIIGGGGLDVDCANIPDPAPPHSAGWYAFREGNVFKFKRVIQGSGITITEQSDRVIIASTAQTLQNDVDLYVPLNHPNAGTHMKFADIQQAHDYLKQFTIPSNLVANIHVYYAGTVGNPNGQAVNHATGNGFLFDHPNAKQINLMGEPRIDSPIASQNSISATKAVNLVNANNIPNGARVYIWGADGRWLGGCRVLSKSGNVVNLSILNKSTKSNYNQPWNGSGARVSFLPTLIDYTGTPPYGAAVLSCPYGIGLISNICFEGASWILNAADGGAFQNIMIIGKDWSGDGTRRCLALDVGNFGLGGECVFCGAGFGLTSAGQCEGFDQTIINGCGQGVIPGGVGTALGWLIPGQGGSPFVCFTHCYIGINADGGQFVGGAVVGGWNDIWLQADMLGAININSDPTHPSFGANNTTDLYAIDMGMINFKTQSGQTLICSPPADTYGQNRNSFIHLS
jgi:hypothetical protein